MGELSPRILPFLSPQTSLLLALYLVHKVSLRLDAYQLMSPTSSANVVRAQNEPA